MNKAELVEAVAAKVGMTKKETNDFLNAFVDVVSDNLIKGEKVTVKGFGIFSVHNRKGRIGRNPSTGEMMEIESTKTPTFKASSVLKEKINK